jgi:2-dehydropantoate 2-reductase
LVGLGAVGTLFAARIAEHAAEGLSFRVLADAARIRRYRTDPPVFNGRPLALSYADPAETAPTPADLILVTVKSHHLCEAMDVLAAFMAPHTQILPLLNGIEARPRLAERFGEARVLYGLVFCNSAMRTGRCVRQDGAARIVFGEAHNPVPPAARVRSVADFFAQCGIDAEVPADMQAALWRKFILNTGLNQAEAIYRLTHGALRGHAEAISFAIGLMDEAAAIAAAVGIPHAQQLAEEALHAFAVLSPEGKSSMLQDIEAGRPPEIDLFAGTIVRLGRQYGIPTPLNGDVLRRLQPKT